MKTQYFQLLLYFSQIEWCFETQFQARNMGFMIFLKSLRVVFPAACGEFVIPAEAGIQKTGLDSALSAE